MAKLIPPEPGTSVQSPAERDLFPVFRTLSDSWTVLHSVGLARHKRKRWAEADFVLVGPAGVFVLEVKGGRVAFDAEDGQWIFTNRHGREERKAEGPYDQAGGGAGALHRHFEPRFRDRTLRRVYVGWAVIFPDITFDAKGSDGIQELTYDTRDRHLPIKHFVDRIAGYWWERSGSGNPNLTPTECRQIVESIRPGFDFRPSLRARADRANDELLRLTSQQITVLEGLIENERSIVSGGAGTGKTLLAVEEARRQARAGSSVLLTCFSRGLASFLADVCSDCQGITVRHLHGILWDLVEEAGLQDDVAGASPDDLFSLFLPAAALKGLEQLGDRHRFDVLIVDEAQDLLIETYIEVFDALLRGGLHDGLWKIFLDAAQDLFTGIDHSQFALLTNARPGRFRLAVNCRNTEQIAVTSAILSSTDLIDARTSGPSTETHYFRDEADLRRKVARILNRLFSEQFETEAVTILSTRKLEATGLETVLPDTRVKLFDASDQRWDFTAGPNSVSFRTVASFKGLESDVVVLIGDNRIGTATGRVDMYVGTTRARVLLIVLLPESARDVCESLQIDFGERLAEVARHDSV